MRGQKMLQKRPNDASSHNPRFLSVPPQKPPRGAHAPCPLVRLEKRSRKGEKHHDRRNQKTADSRGGSRGSSLYPQGHTGSARFGAEKNDIKATDSGAALLELLGSNKIPPLDAVQMLALLHHLFKAADRPLRFQVAEVVYRYDHDHPNAQALFLACIVPTAAKAARRKAEKLFVHPSDWQIELMYDGAVTSAFEMFQLNPCLSSIPNAFRRYILRGLSRGMLRNYFRREENPAMRSTTHMGSIRTRKALLPSMMERDIIARDLLKQVTNYANLRPQVRATLQCIAALGPDFALKEHAYTASGDPDKWKRERDRRPILNPEAIAEAMGIPKPDVHRYLREARVILRQAFNPDGRLFQIH